MTKEFALDQFSPPSNIHAHKDKSCVLQHGSLFNEVLPGKTANVIALTINHIKDDNSEECYTQEELVSTLQEQVSALQGESAQDSAVRAVIQTRQCEAHETIQHINSQS